MSDDKVVQIKLPTVTRRDVFYGLVIAILVAVFAVSRISFENVVAAQGCRHVVGHFITCDTLTTASEAQAQAEAAAKAKAVAPAPAKVEEPSKSEPKKEEKKK